MPTGLLRFFSHPPLARSLPAGFLAVASLSLGVITVCLSGCGGSNTSSGGGGTTEAQTATPTFSLAGGTYASAQTVSLADTTSGATIYYTTDGSTPTTASAKYSSALSVTTTETINALATAAGDTNSAIASATYTIAAPVAATPTFSPAAGTYSSAQSLVLSDTTAGATIYYTTDGSTPSTASSRYTAPINVAASETVNAIAVASGDTNSAVGSASYSIVAPSQVVNVVMTTHDQTQLLAPQSALAFGTSPAASNQLFLDDTQQYQTIEGFGAAFTDSAAYLLEEKAQSSQLAGILSDLFTRNGNGIGLSFMRNPMGASDIARSLYTFDDVTAGGTDAALTGFSIAHDQTDVIPLILAAKQLNPQMKLMANPWSPPAFMKVGGAVEGGTLSSSFDTSFANYFVKYLQAYRAAGILPDYISIQNEPYYQTTGYPSMYMDAPTQTSLLRDYVLPALTAANLPTKIFVWDHNWDAPAYPSTVLSDPTLLASPQIAGTAWHGYGGPVGSQQNLQNQFPAKGNWETEHSGGTFVADQFTSDFNEITLVMRNAGKSYVKWSLALDQTMGPNLSQVAGANLGGCNTCSPIVQVNNQTGNVSKLIEYYTLGQFSKYILPGAVRIWSSNTPTIVSSAFVNPDGSRVLLAFNNAGASTPVQVQWGSQNFSYTIPSLAAVTFEWSGTQAGTVSIPATGQIQGASYNSETGLESEDTGDVTGTYDLGYIVDGATVTYTNLNFGAGISKVSARVASGGGGGTVEFHLDRPTGPLLGTVSVANTGGWQTWQTVTAPMTTATGSHTLCLVFHGSNASGILNMNWFQFQ